jgi:hypothetical protein
MDQLLQVAHSDAPDMNAGVLVVFDGFLIVVSHASVGPRSTTRLSPTLDESRRLGFSGPGTLRIRCTRGASVDPLTVWIIKQLADSVSGPGRRKLSEFLLGDPVQRALRQPTEIALTAAVDAVLGENASAQDRQRAFDIMGMFWTSDLEIPGIGTTLTGALQGIVARAIDRANAPVKLSGHITTTSLTSLSDELGIRIDGDEFAAAFIQAWRDAVRNESLSNAVLLPLENVLAHEQTQAQILGLEERVYEMLWAAVQSAHEQGVRDGGVRIERRLQWFDIHVVPADKLMHEIHDDYRSGFNAALEALRGADQPRRADGPHAERELLERRWRTAGRWDEVKDRLGQTTGSGVTRGAASAGDVEDAMRRLKAARERKVAGRRGVVIIARELLKDRPDGVFGASLDAPLMKYLEAVEGFQRSDAELDSTWYSAYIYKFNKLIEWGDDPHLRSNYDEISGVVDLKGQLANAIDYVLNTAMPKRWDEYFEAYVRLRNACVADPVL